MILAELSSRNWPAGQNSAGPTAVPVGITKVSATFTRENWPAGSRIITVRIDLSYDGGATWRDFIWSSFDGGEHRTRDGTLVDTVTMSHTLHEPDNENRMARVTMTRAVALRTGIAVEAT